MTENSSSLSYFIHVLQLTACLGHQLIHNILHLLQKAAILLLVQVTCSVFLHSSFPTRCPQLSLKMAANLITGRTVFWVVFDSSVYRFPSMSIFHVHILKKIKGLIPLLQTVCFCDTFCIVCSECQLKKYIKKHTQRLVGLDIPSCADK